MAQFDLSLLDYIMLGSDTIILLAIFGYYWTFGTSITKCRMIVVDQSKLNKWRLSLYASTSSVWLAGYFSFVIPSLLRILFHAIFVVTIGYMMVVSFPTWLCKRMHYGGMCNCDYYSYSDPIPVFSLGAFGGISFAAIEFDKIDGLLWLLIYVIFAFIFYKYLPLKHTEPLKYPVALRLSDVDEFQSFLYSNPNEIKLILIVKDTCDFCLIQVEELNRVPYELLTNRLRIFDLSVSDIDPILGFTLNIDDTSKMPVPSTKIYDNGLEIDFKEGVVNSIDIQQLLN